MQKSLTARHGQRLGRLDLPARRRQQSGANDLGAVGAEIEHHGENRGLPFGEVDTERRQSEKNQKQLDEKWRVAEQLDVIAVQPVERTDRPGAADRAADADEKAECAADERQPEGVGDPRADHAGVIGHESEIELIAHGRIPEFARLVTRRAEALRGWWAAARAANAVRYRSTRRSFSTWR